LLTSIERKNMNTIFNWCVALLENSADFLGMSYEALNVVIFVIIWPALFVMLLVLWLRAR
jgi:hypothetical protein